MLFVDFFCGLTDGLSQFVIGGRNKKREVDVFHLIPARFSRIQFRRVRREIFELEPVGMVVLEIRIGGMMRRKVVPDDDDLVTVKMMKPGEKENEVFGSRGAFEDRTEIFDGEAVVKLEKMSIRRSCDEADAGMIVTARRFKEDRCVADLAPGAGTIR